MVRDQSREGDDRVSAMEMLEMVFDSAQKTLTGSAIGYALEPRRTLSRLQNPCGYYLAERGTEFRTMQDYMGHKNPRHTAHYTRISGRKFVGLFK